MSPLTVAAIVFLGVFVQSATGFGLALVTMSLLIEGLGSTVAATLMALVGFVIQAIALLRYRQGLNLRTVGRLAIASFFSILISAYLLSRLDQRLVFTVLGLFVTGYGLYALFDLRLPEVKHPRWAYVFGFASGLFSGAYNVGGPPLIVYFSCLGWDRTEFKGNLQAMFQFNTVITILAHIVNHHFTSDVWGYFLITIPAMGLGMLLGLSLDRFINPEHFRKLVLVFLIFLGLSLIF